MSPSNELLTARVFNDAITRMETRIDKRFDSIDETLAETRERLAIVEQRKKEERNAVTKRSAAWGSAVAGLVMIVVEALKALSK